MVFFTAILALILFYRRLLAPARELQPMFRNLAGIASGLVLLPLTGWTFNRSLYSGSGQLKVWELAPPPATPGQPTP
jgi:hypothetical protein